MGRHGKHNVVESDDEEEVTLLDDEGNPTFHFYESLVELFGRFDVNGDDVLCKAELRTFSRLANADGREYSDEELTQISECFEWKEGLTQNGWLQMYVAQARNDEEGTWQDLELLGYSSKLELPQCCADAKFVMTRNASLQLRLEEFVTLASSGDLQAFVAALAPSDATAQEQAGYVKILQSNGGVVLANLLAELICCATGKDVVEIEGDQEEGPVTFSFWSPVAGGDGEFTFFCQDGVWHVEQMSSILSNTLTHVESQVRQASASADKQKPKYKYVPRGGSNSSAHPIARW